MTKAQILSSVKELSGRYDLDDTMVTGTTKGEFFLDAALKFLDTTQQNPESKRWLMKDIAVDDYKLQFQYCRFIHEVWVKGSDDRSRLTKKTLQWLKENYASAPSELTSGTPLYYAPDVIHLAPQQRTLTDVGGGNPYTDEFTYDYHSIMFGSSYGYNGILFMPPADEAMTVEVLADWFSVLDEDSDQCYWSVVYPNILIQAVLLAIEVFYRNSTGMRDILASLQPYLDGIDKDLASYDAADINQMEG